MMAYNEDQLRRRMADASAPHLDPSTAVQAASRGRHRQRVKRAIAAGVAVTTVAVGGWVAYGLNTIRPTQVMAGNSVAPSQAPATSAAAQTSDPGQALSTPPAQPEGPVVVPTIQPDGFQVGLGATLAMAKANELVEPSTVATCAGYRPTELAKRTGAGFDLYWTKAGLRAMWLSPTGPRTLLTGEGVGLGSSLQQLREAYGSRLEAVPIDSKRFAMTGATTPFATQGTGPTAYVVARAKDAMTFGMTKDASGGEKVLWIQMSLLNADGTIDVWRAC